MSKNSDQQQRYSVRCFGTGSPIYEAYHDEEWGVPIHDDRHLFELLILEGAQAGLSWETILKRRATYRIAFDNFDIKGVAHITGGGFFENIPRMFPSGVGAKIDIGSWDMPPIFDYLVDEAKLSQLQAYSTFNMGLGMVMAVDKKIANDVLFAARDLGESAFVIGATIKGSGVELCG